jgi:hypothetical protein
VPKRHRLRRAVGAVAIVTAWVLASAPIASAANAVNINMILPTGRLLSGKLVSAQAGNAPIPGAFVFAFGSSGSFFSSGSAQTDANGNFVIRALRPGLQYEIDISISDNVHVDGCWTNANANKFDSVCSFPQAKTAALNVANLNVGIIKAAKGYVISGVVRAGTVAANSPLAGVGVGVFGPASSGFTATGAGGTWSVGGLKPGTYNVNYDTPSTSNYRDGVWKSGAPPNYGAPNTTPGNVVITNANKPNVNVILPIGRMVSGTVRNAANANLANAQVSVYSTDFAYSEFVSTNAAGAFTARGLGDGTYKIQIGAPSGSNYQDGYYSTNANHFTIIGPGSNVVVNGNENVGVIKLPAGLRIRGKIYTSAGAPIANAFAGLDRVAGAGDGGWSGGGTNATGAFEFVGLQPGTYQLQIGPPFNANYYGGWFDAATPVYRTSLNDAAADNIVVSAATSPVDVGIMRLRIGRTISGKIEKGTATSHTPFAGVGVSASATTATGNSGFDFTDASGNYRIVGLVPGTYRVSAFPPSGTNYRGGYYKTNVSGTNWTDDFSSVTLVTV